MKNLIFLALLSLSAFASESDLYKTIISGRSFPAAIVVEKYDKKVNLQNFEDFFQDVDSVCYNGNVDDALVVANLIYDDIWIYDEYQLYSIAKVGDVIEFEVLDLFSFEDQDASEDEIDFYIQTYKAGPCQ